MVVDVLSFYKKRKEPKKKPPAVALSVIGSATA